jgi:hypothetical protein
MKEEKLDENYICINEGRKLDERLYKTTRTNFMRMKTCLFETCRRKDN